MTFQLTGMTRRLLLCSRCSILPLFTHTHTHTHSSRKHTHTHIDSHTNSDSLRSFQTRGLLVSSDEAKQSISIQQLQDRTRKRPGRGAPDPQGLERGAEALSRGNSSLLHTDLFVSLSLSLPLPLSLSVSLSFSLSLFLRFMGSVCADITRQVTTVSTVLHSTTTDPGSPLTA